jgi:ribosomal protein L31
MHFHSSTSFFFQLLQMRLLKRASLLSQSQSQQVSKLLANAASIISNNPYTFSQTVVHSDGSSFTLRTTSPKPLLVLTKDTRNHPLWNPSMKVVIEQTGELTKFAQRFGSLDGLDSLSSFESGPAVMTKKELLQKQAAEAAAAAGNTSGTKKGGKKK